jgi:hypothetical protein
MTPNKRINLTRPTVSVNLRPQSAQVMRGALG